MGNELAKLQAQMAALIAENEALKAGKKNAPPRQSMKVSEKGALSVYGLGRFPVSLYKEQWKKLLAKGPEILAYMEAHDSELSQGKPEGHIQAVPSVLKAAG